MDLKQKKHDELVKKLIQKIQNEGFTNINADLPDFEKTNSVYYENKPDKKWFPDASATGKNGNNFIFEVKSTRDAFNFPDVKVQLEIFNAFAKQHEYYFYLIVPKEVENYANEIIKEWILDKCKAFAII